MGALSHRRVRRVLSRYADGEVDPRTADAVADHLLGCDRCSHELAMVVAIKRSLRRLAKAEPPTLAATRLRRWAAGRQGLREMPPSQVQCHAPLAVTAASEPSGRGPRLARNAPRNRRRTWVGALVGAVAVITATGAVLLQRHEPSADPSAVVGVIELARLERSTFSTAADRPPGQPPGRMVEFGDQKVWLARHLVDGHEVLIATSDRPFLMPADARPLGNERGAPWLAMRGGLGVVCLSRPTHRLLVGDLPGERLVEIGRQLGPL